MVLPVPEAEAAVVSAVGLGGMLSGHIITSLQDADNVGRAICDDDRSGSASADPKNLCNGACATA